MEEIFPVNGYTLRFAAETDAQALLDIYACYIDTPITFETELPSVSDFAERIRQISAFYPYIVAERGSAPVAYAYAHRHMERAAYRWNAELSVYLRPDQRGEGLGRALYGALEEIARLQNIRSLIGCVTLPNPASEGLHRAMGFERFGLFPGAGYKDGGWHDVGWFMKRLEEEGEPPREIVPMRAAFPRALAVLEKYQRILREKEKRL